MQGEKTRRQRTILRVLETEEVSSQEFLRQKLADAGFDVTQATLSRDLRELGVVKQGAVDGSARYVRPETNRRSAILKVHLSENLLIVKTEAGMAAAVAYRIDDMELPEILGTVAGEDTLLVVLGEDCDRRRIRDEVAARLQVL